MGLSYDDEESFNESVESLRFNPPSNPDSLQGVGSTSSMPAEEGNEDDPNIILEVPRVAEGSSSGHWQERNHEEDDLNIILEVPRVAEGSSGGQERNHEEDDPNIILEVPRVAEGSSSSGGQERSEY